ncbi:hypothetical protein [Saccharothrix deserti]|nr:hypothetical protein [Saccharothrix deserti]
MLLRRQAGDARLRERVTGCVVGVDADPFLLELARATGPTWSTCART